MDRFGHLLGQEDQEDAYLSQFITEDIAWSRIVWDISTIAYLLNPTWVPSRLIPSPILREDLHFEPSAPERHPIRQASYCYRDAIFGDLFRRLCHD